MQIFAGTGHTWVRQGSQVSNVFLDVINGSFMIHFGLIDVHTSQVNY